MWTYSQQSGNLRHDDKYVATGYAGCGEGKNNPALDHVPCSGPIPRGRYAIGTPMKTEYHGPFVLPLTPALTNEMHGRSGFLIHGDSIKKPGTASLGCIIMPRAVREAIWASGDLTLEVV